MQRCFLIALALVAASCAKGSKESAPAPGNATGSQPPPMTDPPPVPQGSGDGRSRDQALAEARNQAILGPSGTTTAFDPIDPEDERKPKQDRKQDAPKTGTRGDYVAKGGGGGPKGPENDDALGADRGPTRGPKPSHSATVSVVTLADQKPATPELVQRLKTSSAEVQACYDKALAKVPDLVGRLEIAFTVLPTGALSAAAVTTTTVKNIELEACVIATIQRITLAKPLGPAETKARAVFLFSRK